MEEAREPLQSPDPHHWKISLRQHVNKRWPMQNPGAMNEAPASGFSEAPSDYLVQVLKL